MFMGEFEHSLDTKGRIIVPSKFREELGESFVIARGLDSSLYGYPLDEWKQLEEQFKPSLFSKSTERAKHRYFFSNAAVVDLDKQGRINIPNNLQEHAGLEKDCVIIGVSNRIEIWDKTKWDDYNNAQFEESFEDFIESLED